MRVRRSANSHRGYRWCDGRSRPPGQGALSGLVGSQSGDHPPCSQGPSHVEDLAEDDWRRESPRFQGENFAKNLAVLDQINQLAQETQCTPSQLALAWLLAQGDDVVPIPGTTDLTRLEENAGAAAVSLNKADLERIDSVAPRGVAVGERYHPAMMGLLNG